MVKSNNWLSSDDESVSNIRTKKIESDVEEGELSSDDDEANLEKLFKSKEDRRRLLDMTEKEREEEIFKRSMEFNDNKSRQKAAKKLSELKRKEQFNKPNKKRSLADVFNSDNESIKSFSSTDSIPKKKSKHSPLHDRQRALDSQKQSKKDVLKQLNKNMKQRKEKIDKINKEEIQKRPILESDDSDIDDKKISNVDRRTNLSSSDSEHYEEHEETTVDKVVETVEELTKIKISRNRLEKWVHMPFFKELMKGCFVRVNIGEGPGIQPIYRIAEIIEVVETVKIYDLGKTRTNAGLRLRIGKSVTMFRLLFVSNQFFLPAEFDSWRRRVIADGFNLPKMSFIENKAQKLKEYMNYSIDSEEIMTQVLMSKQRFQKEPPNHAIRKAELTRMKLAAEDEGDVIKANQYQDEIDELNMKMEKLERKRTEGIKNISYINQRNRINTDRDIEKAIEIERQENLEWEKKGGDPFVREPTKPVLNHRKKKKAETEPKVEEVKIVEVKVEKPKEIEKKQDQKIDISTIHNFELNLDIKVDNAHARIPKPETDDTFDIKGSIMNAINNSLGNVNAITGQTGNSSNRRTLNLSDYKQRKGLI